MVISVPNREQEIKSVLTKRLNFTGYILALYEQDEQDELLDTIRKKYVNSYKCVEKIGTFVKNRYSYTLSSDEMLYLTIHIERIIYKSGS